VVASAQATVLGSFSFAARALSQPVTATEMLSVLQAVPGVTAVNVTALYALDPSGGATTARLDAVLGASPAHWTAAGGLVAAELLTVDPAGIVLTEGTP
jgi:hypothetical protein